jgi:hypothetical protein
MRNIQSPEPAIFQISEMIIAHKSFEPILDFIVHESLKCLNAHRVSCYQLDEKNESLSGKSTHASGPEYAEIGLFEEKELARNALKQGNRLLLKEPKEFSDSFKLMKGERKITSLMNVPLSLQGKSIKVLSAVLINEVQGFDEKDLQWLAIFGNLASIAMENSFLLAQVRKGTSLLKNYEQHLGNFQDQLQELAKKETQHLEDSIRRFLPKKEGEEKSSDYSGYSDAFSKTFNIPIISLAGFTLDPLLQKTVGEKYAQNNAVIVVENSPDKIKIALAEPTKFIMDELRRTIPPKKKIEFYQANPEEVRLCLNKFYNPFGMNKYR